MRMRRGKGNMKVLFACFSVFRIKVRLANAMLGLMGADDI